MDNKAIRPKK